MKTCLIITGGSIDVAFAASFLDEKSFDLVIAVDAGLERTRALDVVPDVVVGDFDTVDPSVFREYQEKDGIGWDIHKPEKDETDTELAIETAIESGCDEITVLGAMGGRMDHTLGNLHLLFYCLKQGIHACMVDKKNKVYVIDSGKTFKRGETWGKYVSFIPLSEEVKGITLTGFKYPLLEKDISIGPSLCISNEILLDEASITFRSGVLVCVECHD